MKILTLIIVQLDFLLLKSCRGEKYSILKQFCGMITELHSNIYNSCFSWALFSLHGYQYLSSCVSNFTEITCSNKFVSVGDHMPYLRSCNLSVQSQSVPESYWDGQFKQQFGKWAPIHLPSHSSLLLCFPLPWFEEKRGKMNGTEYIWRRGEW